MLDGVLTAHAIGGEKTVVAAAFRQSLEQFPGLALLARFVVGASQPVDPFRLVGQALRHRPDAADQPDPVLVPQVDAGQPQVDGVRFQLVGQLLQQFLRSRSMLQRGREGDALVDATALIGIELPSIAQRLPVFERLFAVAACEPIQGMKHHLAVEPVIGQALQFLQGLFGLTMRPDPTLDLRLFGRILEFLRKVTGQRGATRLESLLDAQP